MLPAAEDAGSPNGNEWLLRFCWLDIPSTKILAGVKNQVGVNFEIGVSVSHPVRVTFFKTSDVCFMSHEPVSRYFVG